MQKVTSTYRAGDGQLKSSSKNSNFRENLDYCSVVLAGELASLGHVLPGVIVEMAKGHVHTKGVLGIIHMHADHGPLGHSEAYEPVHVIPLRTHDVILVRSSYEYFRISAESIINLPFCQYYEFLAATAG